MYWLFLVLALGAFLVTLTTTHMVLLVLSALAALVFLLLWVKGLYAARIGSVSEAPRPLHPAELQALREQFRAQQATATGSDASAGGNVGVPPAAQTAATLTASAPFDRDPSQP
ncbi:hypothetical protein [Stenotrophomonas sp. UBA7606]|uniref:hypothetical protein n=1 Tax=Stenotrophomonas sp. UBA7606 TaxID=1947559 RepID=UPI0025CDCF9B|nr:hypothetical protein [Stenotrophomonas sp. UBA7606]